MENYDELVFAILLPGGSIDIESGEGVENFRSWGRAKKYLLQQGYEEGARGFCDGDMDFESKKVNKSKRVIKEDSYSWNYDFADELRTELEFYGIVVTDEEFEKLCSDPYIQKQYDQDRLE